MVCIQESLEEMLEKDEFKEIYRKKFVPLDFYESKDQKEIEENDDHYNWLWDYSEELSDFLSKIGDIKFNKLLEKQLNPVRKALENAYSRVYNGEEKNDLNLPIEVVIYLAENSDSLIFTVTDTGKGFDLQEKVSEMRNGFQDWFKNAGQGVQVFNWKKGEEGNKFEYRVSNEIFDKGHRINIKYKF